MVTIELNMVHGGFESRSDLVIGLQELAHQIELGNNTIYISSDAVAYVLEEDLNDN